MQKLKRLLPNKLVERAYIKAGARFADVRDSENHFEIENFLDRWVSWEDEYASRGYRTIRFNDFKEYIYGKPIKHLAGVKRASNEKPIFYAEIYREHYNLQKNLLKNEKT